MYLRYQKYLRLICDMNKSKEIVPWKCHICQRVYDTPSGGVCSRCNHATCHSHLHEIGKKLKLESKWVCDDCLTGEEVAVEKVRPNSIFRIIVIAVIALLAFGFLIDLFSGFYVLSHAKSIYAGLAGLLIVAIFYLRGETGSEWISGEDDVAQPLYKRAFHLLVLLLFAGLVLTVMWFALKYLGLIRI